MIVCFVSSSFFVKLYDYLCFMMIYYTVADWDDMDRVVTQTRGRAFSFVWNPQKLGRVFQKPDWAFQRLGRIFWNKCSAEPFDQRRH